MVTCKGSSMELMRCKAAPQHDDVTRDHAAHKKAMQSHSASNIWWDLDGLPVSMGARSAAVVLCAVIGSVLHSELLAGVTLLGA